jgi:hypothetical protein
VALGSITDGGWYSCTPQPLVGMYFSILGQIEVMNFGEIMAYSQEVI